MDFGLGLEKTIVVVTGAGGQIGRIIIEAFLSAGCYVGAFDIDESKFTQQNDHLLWILADTTNEAAMGIAWNKVEDHFGSVPTVCVCAAAMDLSFIEHHRSIISMSTTQFRETLDVVSGSPSRSIRR